MKTMLFKNGKEVELEDRHAELLARRLDSAIGVPEFMVITLDKSLVLAVNLSEIVHIS